MMFKGIIRVCKWLAFGDSDDYRVEKVGGYVFNTFPDWSYSPTYFPNKRLDYAEFFEGAVQTVPNRRARVDLTYSGINPTVETWVIYDESDGTTVLRTYTYTHTYSANILTNTVLVTT